MRRIIPFLVVLLTFIASDSLAGRPRLLVGPRLRHHHGARYNYWQERRYLNWRYPKYVGGFHANYFRDLGVPPGDVGLRGNGLYATPW